MECRLCSFLIFTFFLFFTNLAYAEKCGDEEYINWMGNIIEQKKAKLGGISSMIPTSLALAQSILETGYGTSYSAKKRHNHFGLSYKGKIKQFDSPIESVKSYFETLSFHAAYGNFRKLLLKGESNPSVLISSLAPVYAEDEKYVHRIKLVIRSCDLEKFDLI